MSAERAEQTKECWPEETVEALHAKLVAEHGQAMGDVIWKMMQPDAPRNRRQNTNPNVGWYDNKGKRTARGFAVSQRGRFRHTRGGK